jgi:hypothetical protein
MKIGINLVGVSYNDGVGRCRNYEDAIDGFKNNVVNPLIEEGHEINYYIYSYDNTKRTDILNSYTPVKKYTFTHPTYNTLGGGDRLPNGLKTISSTYINSLKQLKNENICGQPFISNYEL